MSRSFCGYLFFQAIKENEIELYLAKAGLSSYPPVRCKEEEHVENADVAQWLLYWLSYLVVKLASNEAMSYGATGNGALSPPTQEIMGAITSDLYMQRQFQVIELCGIEVRNRDRHESKSGLARLNFFCQIWQHVCTSS